jgi:hypothetical protein
VGKQTLSFGHEGILFKNSFIMYDRQTKSLWVHTMGEAVKGKLKGKQLEFIPSVVTTFKAWKKRHPKTLVLTGRKASRFMGSYNLAKRLDHYGLSIGQGRKTKLYPFRVLREKRVINDEFDGKKVVIVFDEEGVTGRAFDRGKHRFTVKDGKVLDEKGKEWDPVAMTRGKETLKSIPATAWLKHRWKGFYPEGDVYEAPKKKVPKDEAKKEAKKE